MYCAASSLSHNYFPTADHQLNESIHPNKFMILLAHCDSFHLLRLWLRLWLFSPILANKSSLDQLVSQHVCLYVCMYVCWLGCVDLHNCCFRRMDGLSIGSMFYYCIFICMWFDFCCLFCACGIFVFVRYFVKGAKVNHILGTLTNTSANGGEERRRGECEPLSRKMRLGHTPAHSRLRCVGCSNFHNISVFLSLFLFSFCELVNWRRVVFTSGASCCLRTSYSSHFFFLFANLYVGDKVKPA